MKVLLATMQYGRGYSQGTERYLSILCDGLRRRGHEAVVLAADPEHRGPVARLGEAINGDSNVLAYPSRGWMTIRGLSPRRLPPLLRSIKPDIVHLANPGFIGVGLVPAAKRLGLPVAATIMDYWWICPKQTLRHYERGICDGRVPWYECFPCIAAERENNWRHPAARLPVLREAVLPPAFMARWMLGGLPPSEVARWTRRAALLRRVFQQIDAPIFASQAAMTLMSEHAGPRARLVPYGLEPRWFASSAAARRPPAPRPLEELTIGFAGALAPHKGAHLLLDALRRLDWRTPRVRIAGGGEPAYEQRLRDAARGLNVEFLGRVPPDQMPTFMRSLDMLVVPSLWPENLPISVLEAYASGVPVLASDVAGIGEIVRDPRRRFGLGSVESLADCLNEWRRTQTADDLPRISTADEMCDATIAAYGSLFS